MMKNVIIPCWIPSHIGIHGNGKADTMAKESLNTLSSKVMLTQYKPSINRTSEEKWQKLWNNTVQTVQHPNNFQ